MQIGDNVKQDDDDEITRLLLQHEKKNSAGFAAANHEVGRVAFHLSRRLPVIPHSRSPHSNDSSSKLFWVPRHHHLFCQAFHELLLQCLDEIWTGVSQAPHPLLNQRHLLDLLGMALLLRMVKGLDTALS